MAARPTVTKVDTTQAGLIAYGTLAVSGNYVAHGDPVDFSGMAASNPGINCDLIKTQQPPDVVDIYEKPAAGVSASGYVYIFAPGTTTANGVMQVFQSAGSAAPQAELGAGAYPGGVPATLYFQAFFPSLI